MKPEPVRDGQSAGPLHDVTYGRALRQGREDPLLADLYLPAAQAVPAPLVVWLGGQGDSRTFHKRLARRMDIAGIAVAAPQLRDTVTASDLPPEWRETPLWGAEHPDMDDPEWTPAAAMAALEDVARFTDWVALNADTLGLSGDVALVGAGDGASTALNLITAGPYLGLSCPNIRGVMAFSGGGVWPHLHTSAAPPVFAAHNPLDEVTHIGPIRQMAQRDDRVELIEVMDMPHGAIHLWPREGRAVTFGRIAHYARRWCAVETAV